MRIAITAIGGVVSGSISTKAFQEARIFRVVNSDTSGLLGVIISVVLVSSSHAW